MRRRCLVVNMSVLTWVVPEGGSLAIRRRFEGAFGRLGAGVWPILQTAVAASLAWFLASAALGHDQPFFAAIAAVVSTGVVVGQEGRRAIELVFGVACGLAVRAVFPSDPRHIVERAAHPIFDDLVGVLEETAAALRECDLGQAERALQKAREMDGRMGAFREALDAGYDTVRLSPPRRRALGQLGLYATAADQLDPAVRNVRVLARAAAATVRERESAPEALSESVRNLARAVEALSAYIEEPEHPVETRGFALEAAVGASAVLEESNDLKTSMLVGQIQSTAVDLLRASGMDRTE